MAAKEKEDEELTDDIDDTINAAFSEDPRTIVMNFDADEKATAAAEEVDEMLRTFKAP